MDFTVNTRNLMQALKACDKVIPTKSLLPIIQNVLFKYERPGKLSVIGTDLEMQVRTDLLTEIDHGQHNPDFQFEFVLAHKVLMKILRTTQDEVVTFTMQGSKAILKVSDCTFELETFRLDDAFPLMQIAPNLEPLNLPTADLLDAIQRVRFAASTDDLKPAMMGVYFDLTGNQMKLVATDAHLMAVQQISAAIHWQDEEVKGLLPHAQSIEVLEFLAKSGREESVQVYAEKVGSTVRTLKFQIGQTEILQRHIDSRFPDYGNVVPSENPNRLIVGKQDLLANLKRLNLVANQTTKMIRLQVSPQSVTMDTQELDYGYKANTTLLAHYAGAEQEIGLNCEQMIAAVSHITSDKVIVDMGTANRCIVLRPQNAQTDYYVLVMPVLLSSY